MDEAFRYVVLGEYKYVLLSGNNLEIHNGHYLNGTVFEENELESAEKEGLFKLQDNLVCTIDVDQENDFQARDLTPFTPSSFVSTDGIPILTSKASFCIKLFNEPGEAIEFDDKLVFRSNIFTQGMTFKFEDEVYIQSLGEDDYRYLSHDDNHVYFSDDKPVDSNVWFVQGEHPGLFNLYDGKNYYSTRFVKASYGEVVKVDSKDEATVFQILSL
ncbi:hypothetical protein INT43_004960 [Umbelopsis isabellina]|uniref:Uncharacterized protein n=1 Tax=Mortierella isabellina TaxID=91625 RepID=A0A8H7UA46_MORIS|nr:hypothetical protein INT43_004960 [Umbelopsis isabellina]